MILNFGPVISVRAGPQYSEMTGPLKSVLDNDDVIQRLVSFPNVLVTAHQAFFTQEALSEIAQITLKSIDGLTRGQTPENNSVLV